MKQVCLFFLLAFTLTTTYALNQTEVAVMAFEEIGDVQEGAGKEIAAYIVSLLGNDYIVKERLQIDQVVKEKMLQVQKPEEIRQLIREMKNFQADIVLVGQVSRVSEDYSLFLSLCNFAGVSSFRGTIEASTWEGLKEKTRSFLLKNEIIVPPHKAMQTSVYINFQPSTTYPQSPVVALYKSTGEVQYIYQYAKVTPGNYIIKVEDQRYRYLETTHQIPNQKEIILTIPLKPRNSWKVWGLTTLVVILSIMTLFIWYKSRLISQSYQSFSKTLQQPQQKLLAEISKVYSQTKNPHVCQELKDLEKKVLQHYSHQEYLNSNLEDELQFVIESYKKLAYLKVSNSNQAPGV